MLLACFLNGALPPPASDRTSELEDPPKRFARGDNDRDLVNAFVCLVGGIDSWTRTILRMREYKNFRDLGKSHSDLRE